MRILMITRKMDKNDAQAGFNFLWANKLAQKAESLKVICLEKGNIEGLPENTEVFSMGKEKGKNFLKEFFRFQLGILKFINKVDFIFAHQNPEYTIGIGPWAKLFNKPIVSWYSHKAINWRMKLMTFFAQKIVTPTNESYGLVTKKKTVIGHGIDTEMFSPGEKQKSDTLRIISVGRIDPIKNYETLIKAIGMIKEKVKVKVKIIGPVMFEKRQKYLQELKNKVKEFGVEREIEFVGPVAHLKLPEYLQKSDVLINLCPTGSPDKAILEGMACQLVVLVANKTMENDFGNYVNRLIFNHGDETDLAEKIVDLKNSSDIKEIGIYLRKKAIKNHNLDKLMDKILNVFKELS